MKDKLKALFNRKAVGTAVTTAVLVLLCAAVVFAAAQTNLPVYGDISYSDLTLASSDLKALADAPELLGYTPVTQSGAYVMYIDEATTGIALYSKANGKVLYTQIPDSQMEEAAPVNEEIRARMRSNLIVTVMNTQNGAESEYSSFYDSVDNGSFEIKQIQNGVRIQYIIGKIPAERVNPQAISEKRFNEVLQTAGNGASEIQKRYLKLDINTVADSTQKAQYLEQYPACKTQIIYILRPNMQEYLLDNVHEAFIQAGYTNEDKARDEQEIIPDAVPDEIPELYKIPVDFVLNDDVFSASINCDEIKHSAVAFPSVIGFVPYFMSGFGSDEGIILLPDGSGSVMNLNNGKTGEAAYLAGIYGPDPAFAETLTIENNIPAYLPVFGISTGRYGVFADISRGAAQAAVAADVAGKNSGANHVFAQFKLRSSKKDLVYKDWSAAGSGTVYSNRVQPGELTGKLQVDYYLLPDEKAGLDDMAELYRSILTKNGDLPSDRPAQAPGMLVNVLGAFDVKKSVLGIPAQTTLAMTTFEQAAEIADFLGGLGLTFDMRYIGAVNGGYRQTAASKLTPVSALGGKKGLSRLKSALDERGSGLFLEVCLAQAAKGSAQRNSITNILTKREPFCDTDPVTFYAVNNPRYVLKPGRVVDFARKLADSTQKQGGYDLAFRYIANTVTSDCDLKKTMFREQTAQTYSQAIEAIQAGGTRVMLSGGNLYALKSASYVTDMPAQSNEFRITDYSVPFYQMTVSGKIPYSYAPLNLDANPQKAALLALSTGAVPAVTLSRSDTGLLKQTDYTGYYAASFAANKTLLTAIFNRFGDAFAQTAGEEIKSWQVLAPGVCKTFFANGVTLTVNTTDAEYTGENGTVGAADFTIESH